MTPNTLDHIALWVADRDRIAEFLIHAHGHACHRRTDKFTLVGTDARRGKLTLFPPRAPASAGHLVHIALRVSDLGSAVDRLPADVDVSPAASPARRTSTSPRGSGSGSCRHRPTSSTTSTTSRCSSAEPAGDGRRLRAALGFNAPAPGSSGNPRVEAGGAYVEFVAGRGRGAERPLLNHLAVLVDSADEHLAEAATSASRWPTSSDAANTYAVFLWGPERVKVEYVEHKPSFSLT